MKATMLKRRVEECIKRKTYARVVSVVVYVVAPTGFEPAFLA